MLWQFQVERRTWWGITDSCWHTRVMMVKLEWTDWGDSRTTDGLGITDILRFHTHSDVM